MKSIFVFCVFICAGFLLEAAPKKPKEGPYPVDPDSLRQEGVPKGQVFEREFNDSQIYPGTQRKYYVYVPAQYRKEEPAALMVFQDGTRYVKENTPTKSTIVFDNLIHKGDMPVTIGVYVDPGVIPHPVQGVRHHRNRNFEYDAVDDRYVSFLLEEILPEVEKDFNITQNPNLRGVCGSSSGGICAFNVAWQRPDKFRRVYSIVGTFTSLRGGHLFPTLVRKTEPKPLRVFLQDGSNDLNIPLGSWWMANQSMLSALQFSGYEVEHVWGEGYHGQTHGGAIFAQAMRWLWKDADQRITTHYEASSHEAKLILSEQDDWELISEGHGFTEGPAVSPEGELYFSDLEHGLIHKYNQDDKVEVFWDAKVWLEKEKIKANKGHLINGLAFDSKGNLFGCSAASQRVLKFDLKTGKITSIAEGISTNDIVVANNGRIYVTEPKSRSVWMIVEGDAPKLVSNQFSGVNGITLNEDQSCIYVADYKGRYVWFAQLRPDGLVDRVAPHHHLHLPITSADTRGQLDGMCVDKEGNLYTATALGVQVSNWNGLVTLIMPPPIGARHPANVTFGGEDGRVLYATCGEKVYRRSVLAQGIFPWKPPLPPKRKK